MWGRRAKTVPPPEYAAKLAELQMETEFAETVQGIVEAREPFYERLGQELLALRVENHFRPLFIHTIGSHR